MAATRGEGGGGGGKPKAAAKPKGGGFDPGKFAGEVSSNFSKGVGVVAKDVGSFKGPTLSDLKFPGFPDLKPNLAPPPSWINPTGGKKNKWP